MKCMEPPPSHLHPSLVLLLVRCLPGANAISVQAWHSHCPCLALAAAPWGRVLAQHHRGIAVTSGAAATSPPWHDPCRCEGCVWSLLQLQGGVHPIPLPCASLWWDGGACGCVGVPSGEGFPWVTLCLQQGTSSGHPLGDRTLLGVVRVKGPRMCPQVPGERLGGGVGWGGGGSPAQL